MQLPSKKEVIVKCPLSLRQKYLYDEFISHDFRKKSQINNDFINLMNLLMQLRKTCNHPNLVEEKQVKSALQFPRLTLVLPKRLFLRPKADGLPFGCHFGYDPSYEKNTISGFSQFDYEFLVKNRPSKGRINNMLMINHHTKEKQ